MERKQQPTKHVNAKLNTVLDWSYVRNAAKYQFNVSEFVETLPTPSICVHVVTPPIWCARCFTARSARVIHMRRTCSGRIHFVRPLRHASCDDQQLFVRFCLEYSMGIRFHWSFQSSRDTSAIYIHSERCTTEKQPRALKKYQHNKATKQKLAQEQQYKESTQKIQQNKERFVVEIVHICERKKKWQMFRRCKVIYLRYTAK